MGNKLKPVEEHRTKIVSTKVTQRQFDQLDNFCKRRGFASIYEWIQAICFITLKFDDMWHGCPQSNEEQINDFLRPFLDVEDPALYVLSCKKEYGGNPSLNKAVPAGKRGDIREIITVRDGGYISRYRREGEDLKVCHNVDEAALMVATAGRPQLRELVLEAMQANRITSFCELLRILINDALPDIQVMRNSNAQGYRANQYGIVPKKTHSSGAAFSNINPYLKKCDSSKRYPDDYEN